MNAAFQPAHDVSGVIGLSGKASGTVVVSVDREVAMCVTEKMLGDRPDTLNADVMDAIGEITNMIAGRENGIGPPRDESRVADGDHGEEPCDPVRLAGPDDQHPILVRVGDLTVEVGLIEEDEAAAAKRTKMASV